MVLRIRLARFGRRVRSQCARARARSGSRRCARARRAALLPPPPPPCIGLLSGRLAATAQPTPPPLTSPQNLPFYRVVVAEARTKRDGRPLEQVGWYDPHPAPDGNKHVGLNFDRIKCVRVTRAARSFGYFARG